MIEAAEANSQRIVTRVPASLAQRIDAAGKRLAPGVTGLPKSLVLRTLLERGAAAVEAAPPGASASIPDEVA